MRQELGHGERLEDHEDTFLMMLHNGSLAVVELAVQGFVCCCSGCQDAAVLRAQGMKRPATILQECVTFKADSVDQHLSQGLTRGFFCETSLLETPKINLEYHQYTLGACDR